MLFPSIIVLDLEDQSNYKYKIYFRFLVVAIDLIHFNILFHFQLLKFFRVEFEGVVNALYIGDTRRPCFGRALHVSKYLGLIEVPKINSLLGIVL